MRRQAQPSVQKLHEECPGGSWCDCQHHDRGVNWKLVSKPGSQAADPTTKPVDC